MKKKIVVYKDSTKTHHLTSRGRRYVVTENKHYIILTHISGRYKPTLYSKLEYELQLS